MAEKKRAEPAAKRSEATEPRAADVAAVNENMHYDLDPRKTTSIVNGNRVIVLSKGIASVDVARSDKA